MTPSTSLTDTPSVALLFAEQVERLRFGDIVADRVTREIGSWRFILVYFALLLLWVGLNTVAWWRQWDPYPFIFLNLVLSFQGAFAAPIILMSQNRQEAKDRRAEQVDHAVNLKAEQEVALLQASIADLGQESRVHFTHLCAGQLRLAERLVAIETKLERNERASVP